MVLLRRVICSFILLFTAYSTLLADVKSDAATKIMQYYSLLQQYASDPSRVELNDRIKNLFVDGQGSVYNDIYTVVYNNPVTNSDILNYVTAIGAYKNKSGGHTLNIEVNQNSFQFKVKDSHTVYVTVSKRVFCRYGSNPIDFVTKEVVLFQNNKIVCVFKEGSVDVNLQKDLVISNIEFGSCDKNSEVIADFGSVLYALEIPYLNMRFSYSSSSSTVIYVKIIDPQGKLHTGSSSPPGYTTKYTLSPSSSGTFVSGWGNESKTSYVPGNYTVEVWSENHKLYSKNIYLHSNGPHASITDVKVAFDDNNVVIKTTFSVKDMKGKDGAVSCYFYDSSGAALKDINSSYDTTTGNVAVSRKISPGYVHSDYTDFEVSIPKSELHQTGSYSRMLKVLVVVWDKSSTESKELSRSSYVAFNFTPSQDYLSVSKESLSFGYSGGTSTITVSANGPWEISVGTASWGHTSVNGNIITLSVDRNYGDNRTDYFKIKSGGIEKRIDIRQDGNVQPAAEINNIVQQHNVFQSFVKGMNIKVEFDVTNMKGRSVTATALFYYADNTSPLKSQWGSQVSVSKSDTAPYENTTFTMNLFIPYSNLNMAPGWSGYLSFDIVVKDSSGNQLVRKNNQSFSYMQSWY